MAADGIYRCADVEGILTLASHRRVVAGVFGSDREALRPTAPSAPR